MTTMTQAEQPDLVENKGWGGRLLDTLIAPDQSFAIIRDHKSWLWILTALLIILAVSFPQVIIIQRTITQFQADGPELPPGIELSEEEIAQMQAATPTFTFWFGLVGVIVGLIIIWLVWAGVILLFVSMFGGRAEFGRLWRLSIWAFIPSAIQGVLNGIYLLVAGGTQPLLTSLAGFLPNFEDSPALFALAGWLDPFAIWRLLLLILGVMIIAKLNWKKSAAIIVIPWLIGVGIAVGIASATASFAF